MKIHLTGITRYFSLLFLTLLITLSATGCFWFQCNIWGGGECGDEVDPPPIGDLKLAPGRVSLFPGATETIIVSLADKVSTVS